MNCLKQAEKFLKTSLKGKVNLTTGVMVAFLLAGNLSFAATEITNATKVPITQGGEYILGESNVTLKNEEVIFTGNSKITVNKNQSLNLYRTKIDEINGVISNAEILGNGNIFLEGRIGLGIGTNSITANSITLNTGTVGISGYTKKTTLEANDIDIKSNWFGIQFQGDGNGKIEIKNFENLSIYARDVDGIQQAYNTTESNLFISGKDTGTLNIIAGRNAIRHLYGNNTIQAGKIILNSVGEGIYVEEGTLNLNGNIGIYRIDQATENNFNIISNTDVITTKKENGSVYINKTNIDKEIKINGNIKSTGLVEANFGSNTSYLTGNAQTINKGNINLSFYNGATWNTRGDSIVTELTLNGGKVNNNNSIKVSEPIEMLGSNNGHNSVLTGSGSYSKTGTGNLVEISNQGNEFNLSSGASLIGNIIINNDASLINQGTLNINGLFKNYGSLTLNNTISLTSDSSFTNNSGAELIVNPNITAITNGNASNLGIITLQSTQDKNTLSKLVDNSTLTNFGVLKLNDYFENSMTEDKIKELLENLSINNGVFNMYGTIVNHNGDEIYMAGVNIPNSDNTVKDVIDISNGKDVIKVENDTTIKGSEDSNGNSHILEDKVINISGNLTFKPHDDFNTGVALNKVIINVTNSNNITTVGENHIFNNTNINLIGNSNFIIGNGNHITSLKISSGAISSDDYPSMIQTTDKSTLILENIAVGVDIIGSDVGTGDVITHDDTILHKNLEANKLDIKGNTTAHGEINFTQLTIGISNSNGDNLHKFFLSSGAKLINNRNKSTSVSTLNNEAPITINENGQLVVEVTKDGNNALGSSTGLNITKLGTKADKADIVFFLDKDIVAEKIKIQINNSNIFSENIIFAIDSKVYILEGNLKDGFYAVYNEQLTEVYQNKLNELNKLASHVGEYLSLDKDTRITQLDKLYTNSIYSETVKAAYDNIKLNEESILELNIPSKTGEWNASGKALYNKITYTKKGILKDNYNTKTDTAGLLGVMEYGIDDTTSIGIAFSGANQSIKNDSGSADGTILYLGTYGKKEFGKYSIIGGIGYQFANYDANNNAGSLSASDNYSSNTISLYSEGKYSFELSDDLNINPKTKLGYTYVTQEDTMDNYFGVKDADISTFDIEIGADIVKTLNISNGKINLSLGSSYIRTLGDTDKEFHGRFIGSDGTAKVLGSQIAKNTGKFTFDLNISKDSGINYTTGAYLKIGDDNSKNYGVHLGLGYTF